MAQKAHEQTPADLALGFGILTGAIEYARRELPEIVPELEERQIAMAKRLVEL